MINVKLCDYKIATTKVCSLSFCKGGKYHRANKPAVQFNTGTTFFCFGGSLHNLNGPACIEANGYKSYFINGIAFENKTEWEEYLKGIKKGL